MRYFISEIEPSITHRFWMFIIHVARAHDTGYRARSEALTEMRAWCVDQFGPMITPEQATLPFHTGWYFNDNVFTFSDDRPEWSVAFKLRWV